jgi:hypothetical protein
MATLSHQSFANDTTPYWASAVEPTTLVSPVTVVDSVGVPTKNVVISANSIGTGGVYYTNADGTNPFGIGFAQGATQPSNQIIFDVGNVLPAMNVTSSNVTTSLPIAIDSPVNAQNFTITPKANGVDLAMGGAGGGLIEMLNAPTGTVTIMGNTTCSSTDVVVGTGGNDTTITASQVQFGNSGGDVAQVGLSGTSAYLGTSTAPLTTPGVLVNQYNGCELRFTDTSSDPFQITMASGVLKFSTPFFPPIPSVDAITISSTGVVDIPNIVLPSTITTTTLNATDINTSTLFALSTISANADITTLASINATSLNGHQLFSNIQYAPIAATGLSTTGSPGVWLTYLTIPVNPNMILYPSLDFHLCPISVQPDNPPNFTWECGIGVIGDSIPSVSPITLKTYQGSIVSGGGNCFTDCFVLRQGIDYDSTTSNLIVKVIGLQDNPGFFTMAGSSNVMIRGFPF